MSKKFYMEQWRGEPRLWYTMDEGSIAIPQELTEITEKRFRAEKERLYVLREADTNNERYKWQQVFNLREWRGHDVDYRTPPREFKVALPAPIRYCWVGCGAPIEPGERAEDYRAGYESSGVTITAGECYAANDDDQGIAVYRLSDGTSWLVDDANSYAAKGDLTKYPAFEWDNEQCDYFAIGYNGHRYRINWVEPS